MRNIAKYIDPKKIERIILTHCHHDHTGAAVALREATGGKLAIDRHEVGALGDDLATLAHMFGRMSPECSPDDILDEGKVLDLGDGSSRSWRPQATPLEAYASTRRTPRFSSLGILPFQTET